MYSELLSSYIKKSDRTLKEISERCLEEHGVKVNPSYISKLQSGKADPATEEINRAIAAVCDGDADDLQYAAFRDKAPAMVGKLLDTLAQICRTALAETRRKMAQDEGVDEEVLQEFDDALSGSDWELLSFMQEAMSNPTAEKGFEQYLFGGPTLPMTEEPEPPCQWVLCDEQMSPIIPKGAVLHLFPKFQPKSGDLVMVKVKDGNYRFGRTFIREEGILIVSPHPEYEPFFFDRDTMTLIGEVTAYTLMLTETSDDTD